MPSPKELPPARSTFSCGHCESPAITAQLTSELAQHLSMFTSWRELAAGMTEPNSAGTPCEPERSRCVSSFMSGSCWNKWIHTLPGKLQFLAENLGTLPGPVSCIFGMRETNEGNATWERPSIVKEAVSTCFLCIVVCLHSSKPKLTTKIVLTWSMRCFCSMNKFFIQENIIGLSTIQVMEMCFCSSWRRFTSLPLSTFVGEKCTRTI